MAEQKKSRVQRIHDATCPGTVFHIGVLQRICPFCHPEQSKS